MSWLFWLGIVLLIDASIGLWGTNYFRGIAPHVNITKIAVLEAVLALTLLLAYYLL